MSSKPFRITITRANGPRGMVKPADLQFTTLNAARVVALRYAALAYPDQVVNVVRVNSGGYITETFDLA